MDTKRPNYETVLVIMAPKFTKSWSKCENKIMYIVSSNPLVPMNEIISFSSSWAIRGTDEFKWITVPRVHFSIGQDPHCISRVGMSLLQIPDLPLSAFFANQIVTRGILILSHRVMGQMSPYCEILENTSAPTECCWVYWLASFSKSLMNLLRSFQWERLHLHPCVTTVL